MKKCFTLLTAMLLFACHLFAAAPTVPTSNLSFSSLDGSQFTINFTVGNGTSRLVVLKEGSAVSGVPVNGTDYAANASFGTGSAQFTTPGEYVVGKTGWNYTTVSNLKPGTTYYVAIFEYNGSGTATQYLNLPLTGSQSTVVVPTAQSTAITTTGSTGNTLGLSWTKGNGNGRIVLARKGSAVNATPVDLTNYWADENFGSGTQAGTGNYVVYKGTGTSVTVKNLEPNATYHFDVFEYNGITYPMFLSPGTVLSATTNAGPTIPPSSPGFNWIEGNRFAFGVTAGNGTQRLFIAKKGSPVTAVPVNGATYTANAAFGTAGTEIVPGEFVVAAGTGNGVTVTNLEPNTVYHFRVFEYDVDAMNNTYYLTGSYVSKSGSTAVTPSAISSDLHLTGMTGSSATVAFTPGNGTYRMVLVKAGSAVDAAPANLTKYPGNASFGSGTQLGSGNYATQWGMNGNYFTVNNLQPGITYHAAVYEFNGSEGPVYSATGATFNFTIPLEPTVAATSPWTAFTEGASFRLIWNNGNGARRIVVAKKGSAVTAKPTDGAGYTANGAFGLGDALATGEYVVYDGTNNYVNLTNLDIAGTYHFAVYEYNVGGDGKPDYLTSSWLAANAATIGWPATQVQIGSISGLQASQATINFTNGNGGSRIFILKQGSAVSREPQDLTRYNYQPSFGAASTLIGDGNYVVLVTSGSGSFNVTNLQPNTTYYVSAFEFNGSAEPAYLRTAPATASFTTPDVPGATTPTAASGSAQSSNADGNRFTFKWTNGNGENRIVVMKQGSPVMFVPANATSYAANAAFGMGTDAGSGEYIVYNGAGNSVDLSNLAPSSTYYFAVFEYNGTGSLIRYLTTSFLAGNASTVSAPTTAASSVVSATGNGQVTLSWLNGNGNGRIVVMKESGAVTAQPVDQSVYPASTVFKSGSQIAAGEYVVYAGSSNTVTVTGLQNKTYSFSIFEFNGSAAPVYNTTAVAQGAIVASSTLPVGLRYFTATATNGSVKLTWATAAERSNAYFVVERSSNGQDFAPVKKVSGAGNSNSTIVYSITDDTAFEGKMYYRLKQVDTDGNSSYSPVVTVTFQKDAGRMTAYPNPAKERFRVSLPASIREAVLTVYTSSGAVVHRQAVTNTQSVSCASWKSGIYYLTIQAKENNFTTTLVK